MVKLTDAQIKKVRKAERKLRDDSLIAMAEYADKDGASFEFARSEYDQHRRTLKALPKPKGVSSVRDKPIYQPFTGPDFLRDLAVAAGAFDPQVRTEDAQERLMRHSLVDAAEARDKADKHSRGQARAYGFTLDGDNLGTDPWSGEPIYGGITPHSTREQLQEQTGVTFRALGTTGAGSQLLPPVFLSDQVVAAMRSASPLFKNVPTLTLPGSCLGVTIPAILGSANPEGQTTENTQTVPDGVEATGYIGQANTQTLASLITCPVRMFATVTRVAQQVYDRSDANLESILTEDAGFGFAEQASAELVLGTGEGDGITGQLLGLASIVPDSHIITDSGSFSAKAALADLAAAAQAVSIDRRRPPTAILLDPSTYFALVGGSDSTNEPTLRPGTGAVVTQSSDAFGPLLNLPVYLEYAAAFAGLESGQVGAFVVRFQDLLLFMDPLPRVSWQPEGAGANTLTGIYTWHTYLASALQRYPYGIGYVSGAAWAQQS